MKYEFLRALIMMVAVTLLSIVLNPDWRNEAHAMLIPNERVILAVAQTPLDESKQEYQVLKVKTKDGIYVEVYGEQKFLASAKLPDKKDGYFTFNSVVTNLAIDDIDNDKNREILVTSFDDNLVAHLNVYKFIKGQKDLTLVKLN